MYVDLPAMFGPVISIIWSVVVLRNAEFGTNGSASGSCSIIGCRPSTISRTSESSTTGRTYPAASARSANASVASRSPSASAVSCISTVFAAIAPRMSRKSRCSMAIDFSCAPSTFDSYSLSSGVVKRSPVVSVWRRM